MKMRYCRAFIVLVLAVVCYSCRHEDVAEPVLTADQTRLAMLGTWKIEKVDYGVCRSGSCTDSNYTGTAKDYFEFRADSAFLVYNTALKKSAHNAYKADFCLPGAFILSREFWKVNFEVRDYKPDKVVLVSTYAGNDPYARFTDIYYLYR